MLSAEDRTDPSKLNQLGMSLKEKLKEIKVLDSEILTLVRDEELEDEIAQADLYKERIYSTLIMIEKSTAPASLPSATAAETPTIATALTSSTPAHSNKVRSF